MERKYSKDLKTGEKANVKGWVKQVRDLGGLKFFILRDREGQVQVTVKKEEAKKELIDTIGSLSREDCVSVLGKVKESKQAPGGIEIFPEEIKVVSKAETPLPLETSDKIQSGLDKRFEYRFIDVRSPIVQAIFRLRHSANNLCREYYDKEGFVEVHTPIIQAAGAEGGSTLFPLVYYKKEAFLRQSPQLYKQILMASSFDRVYEIGSAFRAEKFHTRRHVSEYLSVDGEMAWIDSEEDVLKNLEGLSRHILKGLKDRNKAELETLGAKFTVPELPFPRLTYDDVLKLLGKEGVSIEWGGDLEDAHEKLLGEIMTKKGHEWFFITKYPSKIKPFYIMFDGEVSRGFDLDFRGMEVSSGGQREHRHDVLVKVMREKNLQPENFKFYLDAFRYGMPPHGGYGYGLERVIQQCLGLDNIKEAILFPRTPERLIP
jgi:aspartyl-tRNA synthetase